MAQAGHVGHKLGKIPEPSCLRDRNQASDRPPAPLQNEVLASIGDTVDEVGEIPHGLGNGDCALHDLAPGENGKQIVCL